MAAGIEALGGVKFDSAIQDADQFETVRGEEIGRSGGAQAQAALKRNVLGSIADRHAV
jgi:hypothetical protein